MSQMSLNTSLTTDGARTDSNGRGTRALVAAVVTILLVLAAALVTPPNAAATSISGGGDLVDGWQADNSVGASGRFGTVFVNNDLGAGWCIDPGLPNPNFRGVSHLYDEIGPQKLTHLGPLLDRTVLQQVQRGEEMQDVLQEPVPFEGHRRDVVIHLVKLITAAYHAGDEIQAQRLAVALQAIGSTNGADSGNHIAAIATGYFPFLDAQDFEELTGYAIDRVQGQFLVEWTGGSAEQIPAADADEFVTVLIPRGYDISSMPRGMGQRIITIDQPGLKPLVKEHPKNPQISTSAEFAGENRNVEAGATITDTVTYRDLVPGRRYELTAHLIDLADRQTVVGNGRATFIAETPDGETTVDIRVFDNVEGRIQSAVATEFLTSTQVDATGREHPMGGPTEGDTTDDNQIASHNDLDDAAQTVTSEELPSTPAPTPQPKPQPKPEQTPAPAPKPAPKPQPRETKPAISTEASLADGSFAPGSVVNDTVAFTGLTPGERYTLNAVLMCRDSAAPTGAHQSVNFVPQAAEGTVVVPVHMTDADCGQQVVFETLHDHEGAVVAVHHDLDDAAQTVTRPAQQAPAPVAPAAPIINATIIEDRAPVTGAPLPADAGRREILSIPSGSLVAGKGVDGFVGKR